MYCLSGRESQTTCTILINDTSFKMSISCQYTGILHIKILYFIGFITDHKEGKV